ncbi:MAG: PfkB family carbohydrate kinase [Bacteroidales bacterium]|jgi:fructokinase|nr:PfkB family carbohydrate kinase [Bacteroidales bacterium]
MIYCIGETVLDIVFQNSQPQTAKVGGSALNSAVSLATLGNKVSFISELGNDHVGTMCCDFLRSRAIDISYLQRHKERQTAIALAFLNEHNNATYEFYKDETPECKCTVPQLCAGDMLLVASSFAIKPHSRKFLRSIFSAAQRVGTTILYDPNMRAPLQKNTAEYDAVFENFAYAHIVRVSNDDCLNIWGHCNTEHIYSELQVMGVQLFVCTFSNEKVEVFTPHGKKNYKVPPVQTLSTVGAGDTFNAGLLHCLNARKQTIAEVPMDFYDQAIPFAIRCSAHVCCSFDNYLLCSTL